MLKTKVGDGLKETQRTNESNKLRAVFRFFRYSYYLAVFQRILEVMQLLSWERISLWVF